jgi:L-xylulokinase
MASRTRQLRVRKKPAAFGPVFLGVDTGGTMAKAALFDLNGHEIASDRRSNEVRFPKAGHTEIDAENLWSAVCEAVRGVIDKSGVDPERIEGVSTTGHGNGLYAIDKALRPAIPGIISTDSRAAETMADWSARGLESVAEQTILQRFWSGQTLPLLGWFKANEPRALDRAVALLGSKDYVRARLTGEVSSEITEAAVSGLADLRAGAYTADLFGKLGLADMLAKLPPIERSLEIGGRVTAEAASKTGVPEGTPVVRGLTDVVACAVASGVLTPDHISIIAGTFSVNQTLHASPKRNTAPMLQMPYPIGGQYLASECSATSASNLEWVCRTLLRAEGEKARGQGKSIYDVCGELVATALARPRNGILFFPYLFGGPAGAPAGFVGLQASHDLADVMRAVFEGVAFAHRLDIERLRRGPDGASPTIGKLSGGAARSAIWPQIFADVLNLRIETTACNELGALGAAMSTATALGAYGSLEEAVSRMTRLERSFEPNSARVEFYERKFVRFADMTQSMASLPQSRLAA